MSRLENPTWVIGITSAPRRPSTLDLCLESLIDAGWNTDIHVFAEPGCERPGGELFQWHQHDAKHGCWGNWLYTAKWLLANTTANVLMTVQDDASFHPESKQFAESILWPSERTGFLSLYTPKHYAREGVHRISTDSLWGTVAVIWPRNVLEKVVDHRIAQNWMGIRHKSTAVMTRRRENPALINNADFAIGQIIKAMQLEMWFITPSPVAHVSKVSTINHGGNLGRRNCLPCADHNRPLAEQVAEKRELEKPKRRQVSRFAQKPRPRPIMNRVPRRAVPRGKPKMRLPRHQAIMESIRHLQALGVK